MQNNFPEIFTELKSLFKRYENSMKVLSDTEDKYYLVAGYSEKFKKDIWFGGVQIMKNYVSLHFIPVYMYPELLNYISPEVKKKMGKACFNFKKLDNGTIKELDTLIKNGFKKFEEESLINKKYTTV